MKEQTCYHSIFSSQEAEEASKQANQLFKQAKAMKTRIFNTFTKLGLPAQMKGFDDAMIAVELLLTSPEKYSMITKELYPAVAKIQNTTPSKVERHIRVSVQHMLDKGNFDYIEKFFGTNYALPNSQFLFTIAKRIKLSVEDA